MEGGRGEGGGLEFTRQILALIPNLHHMVWNFNQKFLFNPCRLECSENFSSNKSKTFLSIQKMKFLIKDFLSKCDQIRSFLQI